MSDIEDILVIIGKKIKESPLFEDIKIYWDEVEITPTNAHFPCILFKLRPWQPTKDCGFERILEIRILSSTKNKRKAILSLWNYEENLQEIIEEAIISGEFSFFELNKLGGSELAIMTYAKKEKDSYKTTGTLNCSAVIDYFRLRY